MKVVAELGGGLELLFGGARRIEVETAARIDADRLQPAPCGSRRGLQVLQGLQAPAARPGAAATAQHHSRSPSVLQSGQALATDRPSPFSMLATPPASASALTSTMVTANPD